MKHQSFANIIGLAGLMKLRLMISKSKLCVSFPIRMNRYHNLNLGYARRIPLFVILIILTLQLNFASFGQETFKNEIEYHMQQTNIGDYQYRAGNLGFWSTDSYDLPAFHYAAELPLKTIQPDGTVENDPSDPVFLIGNYRYNMFIHASGRYSVMSMERSTARLNYGANKDFNTSENESKIAIDGLEYLLSGLNSEAATNLRTEKVFGVGYAHFKYDLGDDIELNKTISTPPSQSIEGGCSGAVITVKISNNGTRPREISYSEGITARYHMMVWDNPPFGNPRISYPVQTTLSDNKAEASFIPVSHTPLVTKSRTEHAWADGFPPTLILEGVTNPKFDFTINSTEIDSTSAILEGTFSGKLEAGEQVEIHFLLGYDIHDGMVDWEISKEQLISGINANSEIPFRKEWKEKIPEFNNDNEHITSIELKWDVYVLYAMANWNEFYQQTYIPQGTLYDYALGVSAATNDLAMHTLPMSYVNPELAKSALTFILKHANHRGEIYGSDEGAGRIPLGPFQKSHLHPTTLHAIAEYLRINKDAGFLTENIPFWGYHETTGTVLDRITRIFLYLRDEINTGQNGLVRTLCSDLSDGLYFYFDELPYFSLFHSESGSNTSLTVVTLQTLADALDSLKNEPALQEQKPQILQLITAIRDFRSELLVATQNMLEMHQNRMPRTIINGRRYFGIDNLFLEPNAGCLAISEIPLSIREQISDSIYINMVKDENLGARNLTSVVESYKPGGFGVRHNGGYWISRHGYYTIHLHDVNPELAWEMLERMTMKRHSDMYPNYWVGAWSGPDEYNASVSTRAGLTSGYCQIFPVYCAHQHAWPLYAYLYMKDKMGK